MSTQLGPSDKKDAAELTGVTEKEVSEAWHSARDEVRDTGYRDYEGLDNDDWRDAAKEEFEDLTGWHA